MSMIDAFYKIWIKKDNDISSRYPYHMFASNDEVTIHYNSFRSYPGAREELRWLLEHMESRGFLRLTYEFDMIVKEKIK